jgi:hypothetical protein
MHTSWWGVKNMTDQLITVEATGTKPEVESTEPTAQTDDGAGIFQTSSMALRGESLEKYVFGAGAAGKLSPPTGNSPWTTTSSTVTTAAESKSEPTTSDMLLEKASWSQRLRDLGVLVPSEVDRICSEDKGTRFLVKDMLPVQCLAIVGGESTIGKSPLLYQLAICVAEGIPFLGMDTENGCVLYFDLENDLHDSQGIRDSLLKHLGLSAAPGDFLLCTEPPVDLERVLKEVRPKLVIIDSLRAFRPDVTDKPADTGAWLKEIRALSRKYGCAFLIVHHLRKPSQGGISQGRLEDCKAADWLQQMEGPRALVNQTDVRIAIVEGDLKPAALKLKWSRRIYGDSPLMSVERVLDEDEDPLGYRHLTGAEHLSPGRRAAFQALKPTFSTKDAKAALNRTDDPTNKFLQECKQLGLIEKVAKGQWRKLPGSYW